MGREIPKLDAEGTSREWRLLQLRSHATKEAAAEANEWSTEKKGKVFFKKPTTRENRCAGMCLQLVISR